MKHEDKQPGIEEKEGTMSRHLDAVATSTLHLKQLRHQLKGRKLSRQQLYREVVATTSGCRDNNCTEKLSRQHQDVATTIVQRRGRDSTRLSRQQLYREVVTTTSRCRDNNCTEKRSRQHQAVATTVARTRISRRQ